MSDAFFFYLTVMVLQRESNVALCCTEVVIIPKCFFALDPLKEPPCKPGGKKTYHYPSMWETDTGVHCLTLWWSFISSFVNARTSAPAISKIFCRNRSHSYHCSFCSGNCAHAQPEDLCRDYLQCERNL